MQACENCGGTKFVQVGTGRVCTICGVGLDGARSQHPSAEYLDVIEKHLVSRAQGAWKAETIRVFEMLEELICRSLQYEKRLGELANRVLVAETTAHEATEQLRATQQYATGVKLEAESLREDLQQAYEVSRAAESVERRCAAHEAATPAERPTTAGRLAKALDELCAVVRARRAGEPEPSAEGSSTPAQGAA